MKTKLDNDPRRSDPVVLSPYEEKDVIIVPIQPASATDLKAYVEYLTRLSLLRVEYAETPLPSGSFLTFLVHLILQISLFVIGGVLLGVAQHISREEKARTPFKLPKLMKCLKCGTEFFKKKDRLSIARSVVAK